MKKMTVERPEDCQRPTNFEEVLAYFYTWKSPSGAHSQNPDLDAERFFYKQQEIDWCWYKGSKKIPAKTWQGLARTYILAVYNPTLVEKKPLPPVEDIVTTIKGNGWDDETAHVQAQLFHSWYTSRGILLANWKEALAAWFIRGYGRKVPEGMSV